MICEVPFRSIADCAGPRAWRSTTYYWEFMLFVGNKCCQFHFSNLLRPTIFAGAHTVSRFEMMIEIADVFVADRGCNLLNA
jgi:hypothetical protein